MNVRAAYRTVAQWVMSVPGCMIHDRNDISAIVIPLDDLTSARRLSTWPRKVTKTVTKDSSIVFAMAADTKDAVAGGKLPLLVIP